MLLYASIALMVLFLAVTVVPAAIMVILERRAHQATPADVAEAAASVRSGPELDTELIHRAEAIAAEHERELAAA